MATMLDFLPFSISLIGSGYALGKSEQKIKDIMTIWVLTYGLFLIIYIILNFLGEGK